MSQPSRRHVLQTLGIGLLPPCVLLAGCRRSASDSSGVDQESSGNGTEPDPVSETPSKSSIPALSKMKIKYLEIVSPEFDGLCQQYAEVYGTTFSEPQPQFGGARVADLGDGGLIGIRGPLRDTEAPVVRPYLLVDDIQAAVERAVEAGGVVAMGPTPIPEHGVFAIVIHGGIECGFWQE